MSAWAMTLIVLFSIDFTTDNLEGHVLNHLTVLSLFCSLISACIVWKCSIAVYNVRYMWNFTTKNWVLFATHSALVGCRYYGHHGHRNDDLKGICYNESWLYCQNLWSVLYILSSEIYCYLSFVLQIGSFAYTKVVLKELEDKWVYFYFYINYVFVDKTQCQ